MPGPASFQQALREGVVVFDGANRVALAKFGLAEQLAPVVKAGARIARESVARIRDRVAGIQASAPLGKISAALAVIEA